MALDLVNNVKYIRSVTLGCDPELFFVRKGKVIGSEKVIPEEGLGSFPYANSTYEQDRKIKLYESVQDGVQVELHPRFGTCREGLAGQIAGCLSTLHQHLTAMGNTNLTFKATVTVTRKELDSLSEKSRILGCAPSKNLYAPSTIDIDPITYRKRSAGGHIHLGTKGLPADRLCALMDILVGNTCVMIDRDPLAATRRKVYGRAGEYREPPHGFEYRTLSNFWLHSYPLMSFVMGISRFAVNVLANTVHGHDPAWKSTFPYANAEPDLLSRVDLHKVRRAINTNNINLAKKNWEGVRAFLDEHASAGPIPSPNLPAFDFFLRKVEESGLNYWFPEDPLTHWLSLLPDVRNKGWESFLHTVGQKMESAS